MTQLPEGFTYCETCLTYYLDCQIGCPLCRLQHAIERPEKADLNSAVWILVDYLFDYPTSAGTYFEEWLATRDDGCASWIQPILACMRDNHDEQLERYREAGGKLEPDYLGLVPPNQGSNGVLWRPEGEVPTVPGMYLRMLADAQMKLVRLGPHHFASPSWIENAGQARWSQRISDVEPRSLNGGTE